MNKLQELIYNDGERLVPYVSHDEQELIRHRSSYAFFHSVIERDLRIASGNSDQISIADLGFGTGYGCALLSSLPNSKITGVDIEVECETFARQYYPRSNVSYVIKDLTRFVPEMTTFDYVVSRGVLEHVPNGLALIKDIRSSRRTMIDVPYDEAAGNEFHVLTGIREDAFSHLGECEIFYEDLDGAIYDVANKPPKPNMIMVVVSSQELPKISSMLKFPIPPVRSADLEAASLAKLIGSHHYFDTAVELLGAIEKAIKETEVVGDIGCGIVPMNYFRPKLHIMVEPCKEYADILSYRHAGDKSVMILRSSALEALRSLGDNSIDSIFLLDVIEHLEKNDGKQLIAECERVTREQIVVFTPLGFMPQHLENGQADGWGLSGASFQEHRSGWLPEDFSRAWSFYICKEFHVVDHLGVRLPEPYGAFFAIRNFERKTLSTPEKMPDFRRPLPSERKIQNLEQDLTESQARNAALAVEIQQLHARCNYLEESNAALAAEYRALNSSLPTRAARFGRRLIKGGR